MKSERQLQSVLRELIAREPLFHRSELGTSHEDFDAMMAPDFWEIGASGRRYSRDYVLEVLGSRREAEESAENWAAEDFHCRPLSDDVYLLTYVLFQGERKTRRCTVWQHTTGGWKAVFHQGTLVQD